MAGLTIIEKSPGYRINHPNFGDVIKATFAKGVIFDFEVLSTNPFQVSSMVKVTGDWGVSEYIPLFYCPKKDLWDGMVYDGNIVVDADSSPVSWPSGNAVLSQDFDQEKKCYKQAWKSFRCDDEVKVLLSDGVPLAVVGFWDGIPRVGEDLIHWTYPSSTGHLFFKMSGIHNTYPDYYSTGVANALGPDGLELGLTLEPAYFWDGGLLAWERTLTAPVNTSQYPDFFSPPWHDATWVGHYVVSTTYREYFVIVGPILYIFGVVGGGGVTTFKVDGVDIGGGSGESGSYAVVVENIRAGLYSRSLLNSLKGRGVTTQQYSNFTTPEETNPIGPPAVMCTQYPNTYNQTYNYNYFICNSTGDFGAGSILTRPHTKEEMIAAGLWSE